MKLKQYQINHILDLCQRYKMGVEAIAKKTGHSKNTVKKYLRAYGLLPYSYPSIPSGGPPSLVYRTTDCTHDEQNVINQLRGQVQLAYSQGANLKKAFDKKNVENDELTEKITQITTDKEKEIKEKEKLQDKFDKLTDSIGKIEEDHQRELEQNKKDNEELKQQRTNLTDELKLRDNKINEIQEKADRRFEEMLKRLQDLQSKLEKLKDRDADRELYLQENRNTLQRLYDGVKAMIAKLADQEKMIKTRTDERDEFKGKLESLERKHESDWILNLTVALLAFLAGIVTDRLVLPKIKEFILSWGAEHGINTADVAGILSSVNVLQPDTHDNYSGAIPITIASGTFSSGAFVNPYGKTYGYEPVPNQDSMTQSGIYHIDNGVTSETNTSGILCSGAYAPTYGNNLGTEDTGSPNQTDVIPDSQGTSGNVTVSAFSSGAIQTSGAVMINHTETMDTVPTLQPTSSHYIPPPQKSQVYFFPQSTPVPPELIGPFGWIPITQMDWTQSTPFICWLFEQLGYKILSVKKSHDKGADILLERFGERLVIQVKHQQANTGIDALKEVLFGKKIYNATKAIVISFGSPFTRDAPKDAEKAGIEIWDLDRVIDELRRNNIYYPID